MLALRLHKFAFQSQPASQAMHIHRSSFQTLLPLRLIHFYIFLSFPHYNEMDELVYFKRNPFVNPHIKCFAVSQDPESFIYFPATPRQLQYAGKRSVCVYVQGRMM